MYQVVKKDKVDVLEKGGNDSFSGEIPGRADITWWA
jgi:hypothetical protein